MMHQKKPTMNDEIFSLIYNKWVNILNFIVCI